MLDKILPLVLLSYFENHMSIGLCKISIEFKATKILDFDLVCSLENEKQFAIQRNGTSLMESTGQAHALVECNCIGFAFELWLIKNEEKIDTYIGASNETVWTIIFAIIGMKKSFIRKYLVISNL